MSTIDLYQVLRQIPSVTDEQAKHAAASVLESNQAFTKADLKAEVSRLDGRIDRLDGRINLLQWMITFNLALTTAVLLALILQ